MLFIVLSILRVAFVGDPQVDNTKELDYARRSIYKELRERKDLDYVIVLGDLVNENPSLIQPSCNSLDSLGCPWIRVQGNHDGQCFPNDTSFCLNGIRFIMLNRYELRQNRKDIPDSVSLKLLSLIQPGQKTVVCSHVPLKKEITDHYGPDVLFVSAHLHSVSRGVSDGGAGLLVAGTSCGTFWRGKPDSEGIPLATMNCGAPRCYFVSEFKSSAKNWYDFDFKAIGKEASFQAMAFVKDSTLTFDVYGSAPWGRLSARINGKWTDVPFQSVFAPEAQTIREYNDRVMTKEYRRSHKDEFIPILGYKSDHTWQINLDSPLNDSTIKIRYKDPAMKFTASVPVNSFVY